MTYTRDFGISLGASYTGTVLNAQIVSSAGAAVGSVISSGFVEIGTGNYLLHATTIPIGHRGGIKFYATGSPNTILAFSSINPEEYQLADVLFSMDWNSITGTADRSMLNALRFLRNKWYINGTTLYVMKENDTTEAWNSALSSNASADPIVGSDPN